MSDIVFIETDMCLSKTALNSLKNNIEAQIKDSELSVVILPYGIRVAEQQIVETNGRLKETYVEEAPKCLNCEFNEYIDSLFVKCNLDSSGISCEGVCDYHIYYNKGYK